MKRFIAISMSILATVFASGGAAQDSFPSKSVEMIIPTSPGGGTDATFRLLAELAKPALGTDIVILNKPGGTGSVGATQLMTSRPDGYTIAGVWGDVVTVVPHVLPVPYSADSFTPITISISVPLTLCVKSDFPAQNAAEFFQELRDNPDKYTYGTDGVGGGAHLVAERIFSAAGVQARAIPFTDSGTILTNFLGGHVDIYPGIVGLIQPHVTSGTARCILVSSSERTPALPDVESLADVGLEAASTVIWRGLVAPKDTPQDRIEILEKAFVEAAHSERFKEFAAAQGGQVEAGSADDLGAVIARDYEAFGKLVHDLGLARN